MARPCSSCSTCSLICWRLWNPLDNVLTEVNPRVEYLFLFSATVDNVLYVWNRDWGFCNVCANYNESSIIWYCLEDFLLLFWWKHWVERKDSVLSCLWHWLLKLILEINNLSFTCHKNQYSTLRKLSVNF